MDNHESRPELTWRIPTAHDAMMFRARVLQIVFAAAIVVGVLFIFGSAEMKLAGVIALLLGTALTLFVIWRSRHQSTARKDNIRIDRDGVHWKGDAGRDGTIGRDQIESFRIGYDADTVRAIPALTLILTGGFDSQPIELHEPVTPVCVRQFLVEHLGVAEETVADDVFASRLHESFAGIFAAQTPSHEWRLLNHALCDPYRETDGTWRVAAFERDGDVFYDPVTCGFRLERHGGETIDLPVLTDLIEFVRDEVLPEDRAALRDLLDRIDREEGQQLAESVQRDARAAGFYLEADAHGHWHFVGSRSGLIAMCDRIEEAASLLRDAPDGAKPSSLRIGGPVVGITIQRSRPFWIGDQTICGSREELLQVAKRLREQISAAEIDTDVSLRVSENPSQPLVFHFHIKPEHFDPGKVDSPCTNR